METERITVTGIPVDNLRDEAFEDTVYALAEGKEVRQVVFLSLWNLMRARRDKEFCRCVEEALVIPVSKGIQKSAKFLKKKIPARYMPFDFMIRFFAALEARGRSLYILGCRPAQLRGIEQNLKQTFPGLKIVGRYTGHYPKSKEQDICTAIKKASPHCVFIGSGIRGKEKWVRRHKSGFSPGVFIWSPSVMDIISGKKAKVSRETFQRGLEFVPGLLCHPWRVLRGIVYLYYAFLLVIYRIRRK
jgi:N-acetylglucosaminyldiphosphoundecaprenol N-acetyl-beta-D-mannosaminyltransferase